MFIKMIIIIYLLLLVSFSYFQVEFFIVILGLFDMQYVDCIASITTRLT